jgi:hypothetical protein
MTWITMDNAYNNGTLMSTLQVSLLQCGLEFSTVSGQEAGRLP